MTPLIDAARALLELMDEHTQPPWHTWEDRLAWREAVAELRASVDAAESGEDALADIAAVGQTQTALEQRDKARGVARQLWREGNGCETSSLLPGDHPWLLKETP